MTLFARWVCIMREQLHWCHTALLSTSVMGTPRWLYTEIRTWVHQYSLCHIVGGILIELDEHHTRPLCRFSKSLRVKMKNQGVQYHIIGK